MGRSVNTQNAAVAVIHFYLGDEEEDEQTIRDAIGNFCAEIDMTELTRRDWSIFYLEREGVPIAKGNGIVVYLDTYGSVGALSICPYSSVRLNSCSTDEEIEDEVRKCTEKLPAIEKAATCFGEIIVRQGTMSNGESVYSRLN